MTVTCIHGFLGRPPDWDFLRAAGLDVEAIGLDEAVRLSDPGAPPRDVLLGYSMGGRLALEALAGGAKFRRAVIVSAGLNLDTARRERRERDDAWARRFESDPWQEVVRDWNAQPVFGGHAVPRHESDYDRAALAAALRKYSPGVLQPLEPRLGAIRVPLLWIAGERDAQYVAVGRRAVERLPHGELWICSGAGHRVPWEKPAAFIERLRAFVA